MIKTMRIATKKDLSDIVAIYNSTIPTRQSTADTTEVTVESKLEWFRRHSPDKRPLWVREENGKVVAWVSFESFYGRPAYEQTVEISIYISPEHTGKGLGRTLLEESLESAKQFDIKTIVGFIFSHNIPSINLFKSFGFEEWGNLPNVARMDGKEYSLSIVGKRIKK
jgi:L-amino acid N-acyltransferase YncA